MCTLAVSLSLTVSYPLTVRYIQGFFDNINHERLVHTFRILGFAVICRWLTSFIAGGVVQIHRHRSGRTTRLPNLPHFLQHLHIPTITASQPMI
jgi:hypothetical protein